MKMDTDKIKALCQKNGIPLRQLLRRAGVSRTAYYSLSRKESILPKSIARIANSLGTPPAAFLSEPTDRVKRLMILQKKADSICRRNPDCDRDVVLHTLMNLELPPLERLRKALFRGQKSRTH